MGKRQLSIPVRRQLPLPSWKPSDRIDVGQVKAALSGEYLSCSLVYLVVADGETAIIDTSPAAVTPAILEAIRSDRCRTGKSCLIRRVSQLQPGLSRCRRWGNGNYRYQSGGSYPCHPGSHQIG